MIRETSHFMEDALGCRDGAIDGGRPMERSGMGRRGLEILMVEDNPADVGLTIEALDEEGVRHHVSVVEDGLEALAFLHRDEAFADAPRPDLILLDLNIPKMKGHEFLGEMQKDPELKEIPVIVFTTSDAPLDKAKSYALNVNLHIKKPMDLGEFTAVVKKIVNLPALRKVRRAQ
jgi:chemotaxis family two-component system response regulator Rcp1